MKIYKKKWEKMGKNSIKIKTEKNKMKSPIAAVEGLFA